MNKKSTVYKVIVSRMDKEWEITGTLEELIKQSSYTLQKGKSWEHEKGNKKINMNPKTIEKLVEMLNRAEDNAARNGYGSTHYRI